MEPAEDSALLRDVPSNLLFSCDLATLVGNDARVAGRIAVLHAASDIYASGGIPLWGLSLLVLPPEETIITGSAITTGILEAAKECGIAIVGGQTIFGHEPMAGMAVLGTPRRGKPMRKRSAQTGDFLYLSKPLGTSLALRASAIQAVEQGCTDHALSILTTCNVAHSIAAVEAGATACTDVSGFGFLGHACQLLSEGTGAMLHLSKIPVVFGLSAVPEALFHAPWLQSNLEYAQSVRKIQSSLSFRELGALLDPQTNGGLLVSTSPAKAEPLLDAGFVSVGEVVQGDLVIIDY